MKTFEALRSGRKLANQVHLAFSCSFHWGQVWHACPLYSNKNITTGYENIIKILNRQGCVL